MAQGHKPVTVNATVVGSITTYSYKKIGTLSSISSPYNEAKCGAEFLHSTRNASRIQRKVWNGNTTYPTMCRIQREKKLLLS